MIHEILKMGDPRLHQVARPVEAFATPELHRLIEDMFETMQHVGGVGLAAPQIGNDRQLVIFGFEKQRALSRRAGGAAHCIAQPDDRAVVG